MERLIGDMAGMAPSPWNLQDKQHSLPRQLHVGKFLCVPYTVISNEKEPLL